MLLKNPVSPRRRTALVRKLYRNSNLISAITTLILLGYCFRAPLYEFYDYASQVHPWSGQHHIEQPFTVTDAELACLNGLNHNTSTTPTANALALTNASSAHPIPNIVHFVYVFKEPLAQKRGIQFDFLSYLSVRSALVSLEPDDVYLHYVFLSAAGSPVKSKFSPITNPWIRRLHDDVHLVEHKLEDVSGHKAQDVADLLRLQILRDNGGIYLDTDSFALRSFSGILNPSHPRDAVLGYEGGNRRGLRNTVMAARRNSTFVNDWMEEYLHGRARRGDHRGVVFPKELAGRKPDELCALSPLAFFWPTWTWRHVEWMHEELDGEEAARWKAQIERNGGAMFEGQLAYHAWSRTAWARYLGDLSPRRVMMRDTRFNLLVRRFIENDV